MTPHQKALAVVAAGRAQANARLVLAMSGRGRKLKTKRLPGPPRLIIEGDRRIIEGEPEILIKRMTNWQRNQWARAGYPRDLEQVQRFAEVARVDTPSRPYLPRRGSLKLKWA